MGVREGVPGKKQNGSEEHKGTSRSNVTQKALIHHNTLPFINTFIHDDHGYTG